ncbi:MAG TPA: SRPBCC family protein [Jatrophihabitans sp.]
MNTTTNPTTITAEPGTPFLEMVREFAASPERVWHATTDPDLIVRWLGPARNEMRLDVWDVRPGGSYRYVCSTADGAEQGFHGVYHQVVPNQLSIATFEWEGAPDQVCLESVRYDDLGGRTRMTTRSVFPSVQARDMALQTGMQDGMTESMDRLAALL